MTSQPTTFIATTQVSLEYEEIPVAFNKNIIRQKPTYMPMHIFGTGSEGNSVWLKELKMLVDLGLRKKRYLDYDPLFFDKLQYIIITHHHGDHLEPSTLFYVLENYPHIKIIISPFLWQYVQSPLYRPTRKNGIPTYPYQSKFQKYANRFVEAKPQWLQLDNDQLAMLSPRTVKHGDIVNIALEIYHRESNLRMLYCTDIDNLKGASTFKSVLNTIEHVDGLNQNTTYNVMLLEANYTEEKIVEWLDSTKLKLQQDQTLSVEEKEKEWHNALTRANNNRRHISEQDAIAYVEKMLDPSGIFVPLHSSSMFGTLFQK